MEGSELFTGAALEGVPQDVSEEEVSAHPDPDSCTVLPWQKDVAWFAGNLWTRGKPYEACSRNILGRHANDAAEKGRLTATRLKQLPLAFRRSTTAARLRRQRQQAAFA